MQRYSGAMTLARHFAESCGEQPTHFLIEAHNAGFEVRMSAIEMQDYLERESGIKK